MKTCTDCRYCIMQDYGYSNWTVEGTYISCLKNLHPKGNFDRAWGKNPADNFAEQCESFSKGDCVSVDCDRESGDLENYSDDPEIKALLVEYSK